MYDYLESVTDDVKEYINDEIEASEFENREALEEYLNDELWACDSVTGNASGSYTFNAYEAEENISHNWELLEEAMQEFGNDENPITKGAEWCDVTIRCYLLGQAIAAALDDMENELFPDDEE